MGARALHLGALGADGGEVVADAAAAPHRLGGLRKRGVDAGAAVDDLRDRVAHRLHEAVDQRRLELDASARVDPARRDEAIVLRLQEAPLPVGTTLVGLDLGEGARYPAAN